MTAKRTILGLLLLAACAASCASTETDAPPREASRLPATVTDMDGGSHDLGGRAGRPVALVFWQVWCASCAKEAPELAQAAARYGDRIDFLGVVPGPDDLVDDVQVRETARSWRIPYPNVRDRDLTLTNGLGVEGTPTIVVLGADQRVLYRGHRPPEDWAALLP